MLLTEAAIVKRYSDSPAISNTGLPDGFDTDLCMDGDAAGIAARRTCWFCRHPASAGRHAIHIPARKHIARVRFKRSRDRFTVFLPGSSVALEPVIIIWAAGCKLYGDRKSVALFNFTSSRTVPATTNSCKVFAWRVIGRPGCSSFWKVWRRQRIRPHGPHNV